MHKSKEGVEIVSTDSLEDSEELVDLSSIEVDEKSPYGRHLKTVVLEIFEHKVLIREEFHGKEKEEE